MRVLSGRLSQNAAFGLTAALLLVLTSCGGGGGSNKVRIGGNEITDPIIDLEGAPGRFSMTPQEANAFNGANCGAY